MKTQYFVMLGCLLAACGGEDARDPAGAGTESLLAADAPAAATDPASLAGDSPVSPREVCARTGRLDFKVTGRGLSRLEGRRVVVAAYENAALGGALDAKRVVLRAGVIRAGAFSLACDRALTENYAYPSWAAYIDADNNGVCQSGDLGYQMQLYGWNQSVDHAIGPSEWTRIAPGVFSRPLGSRASDFCSGYFGK
jgi:hypothetical protein